MNQNLDNFKTFEDSTDDSIDLGRIIRNILMQSKMIALITITTFIFFLASYFASTKQYKILSLLEIESFNQSSLDPTDTLKMMSPLNSSIDLDHMVKLYKSRTNLLKLINDLQLNVYKDIEEDEILDIVFDVKDFEVQSKEKFFIQYNNDLISIYDENNDFIKNLELNEIVEIKEDFKISLKNIKLDSNKKVEIAYRSLDDTFEIIKLKLDVSPVTGSSPNFFNRNSGLLEVSIISDDVDEGKKIIDTANEIFLETRLKVGTEKSRAAINFLNENIETLKEVTDINKTRLNTFLEANKSINFDLETQAVIETIKSIDDSINELQIEMAKANDIYTDNNPVYISLLSKKRTLENQKNEILSLVQEMPKEQQEYIDLYNDLEVSQLLLEELQTRRLGFSIMEASTIGDIRIVDKAYSSNQVSPRAITIILFTFLSFILACFFAIFRGINLLPITNPAEVLDNNIYVPIIGVIPEVDEISKIEPGHDQRFDSSIETLILNLQSLKQDEGLNKVVLVTSPTPSNGKSTISAKLAQSMSFLNKKVLLIDCDLKRGGLGRSFSASNISKKEFLDCDETNFDNYKIMDNLFLLPKVKGLASTFQFMLSMEFSNKINDFKKHFDLIIIDTAPILSVADTAVLSKISDLKILIARHEITKIREIKQCIDNFNNIGQSLDGIIYNAYSRPKGYYGYYEYYGNYNYQYYSDKYLYNSYDYEK